MKGKFIVYSLLSTIMVIAFKTYSYSLEHICLDFPDGTTKLAEHLISDLEQYLYDAGRLKAENAKEDIVKQEVNISVKKKESIPAGEDAIIQKHFNRPDYKNRKQKDEEDERRRRGP